MSFPIPKPGPLTKGRTQEYHTFQMLGVDYAGPIYYRSKSRCYILLISCSVSSVIHLELVPNLTTQEIIKSIKWLLTKRGSPKIVYSEYAKKLQAGAKWLSRSSKDEKFHNFLSYESITWKFKLSKAPWWGGQFERLIELTKQTLYITIGKAHLKWV